MITAIEIVQSNVTAQCKLISIHQPIVFLANVTYSGDIPEDVYIDLKKKLDDDTIVSLGIFKALPYKDVDAVTRQFAFVADGIIRSFMGDFKDFESEEKTLEYCEGFTEQFYVYFKSSLDENTNIKSYVYFVACHASQQFGDDEQMLGIQNNTQNIVYYGGADRMVYVYVYNKDVQNDLRIENGAEYLVDFDDVPFTDDNLYLTSE